MPYRDLFSKKREHFCQILSNKNRMSGNRFPATIHSRDYIVIPTHTMMRRSTMSQTNLYSDCAKTCSFCAQTCYSAAMNHCLEKGGKHVQPEHFKLMLNCAKVCETSACLQMSGSSFSAQLCAVCADVCEACAISCEAIGEMEECVRVCRECVESCRKMAA